MDKFHAHIYYDHSSFLKAKKLIEKVSKKREIKIGKMHERPIGPHPKWSCQLLFSRDQLASMMVWLIQNRDGLTVFLHPVTGNDVLDHTDYAVWMGELLELNLDELL